MLDKFTSKLNKLNPFKLVPSFMEAVKKASESKDKTFFDKVKIFFTSFSESMNNVKKEEAETTEETNKTVEQGIEETMKDVKETFKLDANVNQEDNDFFDETLSLGVKSMESMDYKHQSYFYSAINKIKNKNGTLSFEEMGSAAAVGFMTLSELKKKYSNKSDFKKALDRIYSISDESKLPIKSLLDKNTLSLFKMKDQSEGLKFLKAFGISAGISDLWGGGEASKAKELFGQLSERNMNKKSELVDFMKKYIFKKTSKVNIGKAVDILNKMATGGKVDSQVLTDLVFTIDDNDYQNMVTALVGSTHLKIA